MNCAIMDGGKAVTGRITKEENHGGEEGEDATIPCGNQEGVAETRA
jgi:hypothetical protein